MRKYDRVNVGGLAAGLLSVAAVLLLAAGCGEQVAEYEVSGDGGRVEVSGERPRLVDEKMVGLPVFPGLEYVQGLRVQDMPEGAATLSYVRGSTTATLEEVLAFYHEHFADWHYHEVMGFHHFARDKLAGDFHPSVEEMEKIPIIRVHLPSRRREPVVEVQYSYE